jgi:hypothetical protein
VKKKAKTFLYGKEPMELTEKQPKWKGRKGKEG